MYQLVGESCLDCGAKLFPPRDVCADCHGEVTIPIIFSGKGKIYSYTKVSSVPEGFEEQAPFYVALVRLNEGPMVTAQLTDLDGEPNIGMSVEMVTRKLKTDGPKGIIVYGYKFRPTLDSESKT